MNINPNNHNFSRIILSISSSTGYLLLSTFDVKHRWSRNFYVSCAAIQRWLDSDHTESFIDHDMDSFLRLFYGSNDEVSFEFSWLHYNAGGDLTGYRQTFYISANVLYDALNMMAAWSFNVLVSTDKHMAQSRIQFSKSAYEQIHKMPALQRNALRKALRHAFTWGRNTTVTLYADCGPDFMFREEGEHGIVGGFCMSKTTITGNDHKRYGKFTYTIHT